MNHFKKITRHEAKDLASALGAKQVAGRYGFGGMWGKYYIAPDPEEEGKWVVIYAHYNPPTDTDCSEVFKVASLEEAANEIWADAKGTIPFASIARGIRDVFGVDVTISPKNRTIRAIFGEAG